MLRHLSLCPGSLRSTSRRCRNGVLCDILAGRLWLVPHIREWLAQTKPTVLVEPFAGGGIVSLTAVMEGLVDRCIMIEIDHDVAAFWHVVLRDGTTLAERVRQFKLTRERVNKLAGEGMHSLDEHGFRQPGRAGEGDPPRLAPGALRPFTQVDQVNALVTARGQRPEEEAVSKAQTSSQRATF